jgi:hypothetical protein
MAEEDSIQKRLRLMKAQAFCGVMIRLGDNNVGGSTKAFTSEVIVVNA